MLDSRPVASPSKSARRTVRPFAYGCMILAVFIAAVTVMSMKDGASGALLTALVAVALAATAVGVWGTAMAVRETHDVGSDTED